MIDHQTLVKSTLITLETCSYRISRPKMRSNEAAKMIHHATLDILLFFPLPDFNVYNKDLLVSPRDYHLSPEIFQGQSF